MNISRIRWFFRSRQYKMDLAEEACYEFGRGTVGWYLFGEILYKLQEDLALDDEDCLLMDIAQDIRNTIENW